MKKYITIILWLILFPWFSAYAAENPKDAGKVWKVDLTEQKGHAMAWTGATAANGVSLVGVIDLLNVPPPTRVAVGPRFDRPVQMVSGQVGASGVSTVLKFSYSRSNVALTTAQWQALGQSGVSIVGTIDMASGVSAIPDDFTPLAARYLGIFLSAVSNFKIPEVIAVGW